MAELHSSKGGCWFCHEDDEKEPLIVCSEWDCNMHITCLVEENEDVECNEEAKVASIELLGGYIP